MSPTDGDRFRDVIRGLCKVYSAEPDAVMLDVYWMTLNDWSLLEFEAAAAHLLRTSKFMPRPADFHALRTATRLTAGEAWIGAPNSSDPIVKRALYAATQGRYYGHIPLDELPWVQKRFVEFYEDMRDVDDTRRMLPHYSVPDRRLDGPQGLLQIGAVDDDG